MPRSVLNITVTRDDSLSIKFGSVGNVTLDPVKDGSGRLTSLMNAPVLGLVEISRADLARSDGSKFADPQMRGWDSGGHGSISPFNWKA